MTEEGPTITAGLVSFLPSTLTRPATIQASASRREQRPARAMRLAIRSPFGSTPSGLAAPSARGVDEGIENFLVAGADGIFRMPLHAEAVAVARVFDAFDHAI